MIWRRHAWSNRLQSLLLLATLLGISALAGSLLLGSDGMWMARSAEFMQTGLMETLRWMRMIGELHLGPAAWWWVIVLVAAG